MPTASDVLPENSGGPAVTKPEVTNVETTGNLDEEEDVAAPVQSYAEYVDPAKSSKRFGLKGPAPFRSPKGNDPFNYEEKYPEDAYCEELGANARVFRTYLDERAIYDANMVEESRDGVDVLLVFAGLFSAVVTTFLAQTSQSLQADYSEMSANLLFEMINIQRAIANGTSLDNVAPSSLSPNIPFIASASSVWVNSLWFTSLALSLTTALMSVLVKQWLHHYIALPSGTPRERSLLRQFRFAGLQKWRVLFIIGLLPVLMHIALAIFFIGVVIFLGPLRESIAWVVGTFTVIACTAYLMAHILPLIFPQCPYRTSLCDLLHISYGYVMEYAVHSLRHCLRRSRMDVYITLPDESASIVVRWGDLKKLESDAVKSVSGELSVEALHWLFSMSSNPTVQSIVVQAIGGLHPALQEKAKGLFNDIGLVEQLLRQCVSPSPTQSWNLTPVTGLEMKLERLLRCNLVLRHRSPLCIDIPDTPSIELPLCAVAPVEMHAGREYLFLKEVFRNAAMSFSGHELWCFHPIVWINLINDAASVLESFSVDITNDPFAIDLCIAVIPALIDCPSKEKDHAQSSDKPISFKDAVRSYLFTDITTYLLRVFAALVHPSNVPSIPPSLRMLWNKWIRVQLSSKLFPLYLMAFRAMTYLHTPDILFNVCSILAVGPGVPGGYGGLRSKKRILSLVQIRPDAPVWDECRRRLQQLLEEDGIDFFHRQTYVLGITRFALSEERIAEQRESIRFAIEILDAFFSRKWEDELPEEEGDIRHEHPAAAGPDAPPIPRTQAGLRGRLHHLLPWHGHEETSDAAKSV
ncbi:hypothetical protein EDD85DRAFT_1021202 [Armillaria nabsnona]|nr:hypothetical protein EDD85DRAFT_1021202 [Armillaria nabsnona]